MDVKKNLADYKIIPNPAKDQFFLTDENLIKESVEKASINKGDTVLEVGAGNGSLTRALAQKAGKVISFEIDERFRPMLADLPRNVEMHFEDAWEYIQMHGKWLKKKEYNKIVANLPYSFAEKFLHNLTFLVYDKVVLIVPLKFVKKTELNSIFGSFFRVEIIEKIDKQLFYPVPRTGSALINLIKLPDPIEAKNRPLFLRQYIYQHEDQKAKNSLVEGWITYYRLTENKIVTKNEARKIIAEKMADCQLLDETPGPKIYPMISERL